MALRRLKKERADFEAAPTDFGISGGPIGDDLFHWSAAIIGPDDTPYAGGAFLLDVRFPNDYPFAPPKIVWITKIFHPCVNDHGGICCMGVGNLKENWSPALTILKTLFAIRSELMFVHQGGPCVLNHEAASLLKKNQQEFDQVAREWTLKHAKTPNKQAQETKCSAQPYSHAEQQTDAKQNDGGDTGRRRNADQPLALAQNRVMQQSDAAQEVCDWLSNTVMLPQYIELFMDEGFDHMMAVQTLTEEDLKTDLRINKKGHRRRILAFIEEYKQRRSHATHLNDNIVADNKANDSNELQGNDGVAIMEEANVMGPNVCDTAK